MVTISDRFGQISESQTVALNSTLAIMRREGKDVVALGAGEPDFDTPDTIKEAAVDAIKQGFTKYTPADGTLDLKDAVCSYIAEEYGGSYKPEQIVITCGAKHAVYQAISAVCNPGDEVILPVPYWVSYPEQIKLAGAIVKAVEPADPIKLKITSNQLEKAISEKTRLLILNSPGNPSGAVYSKEELDWIVRIIEESGIFVLSDEIYDKILFDGARFTSLCSYPEIKEQLLLVNGVSKTFAMTGWRIGFLAADNQIATAVKKYQGHSTSNPTSISQQAALEALRGEKSFVVEMLEAFTERRNYVNKRLTAIPNVRCLLPQGAFYAFPNISYYLGKSYREKRIKNSIDLCAYLMESHGVAVVPGIAFGMDTNVRISYAASMETLEKALDRIEAGLKALS